MTSLDSARLAARDLPPADGTTRPAHVEALNGSHYVLADAVGEAVAVVDAEGRILVANAALGRLFDVSPDGVIGQPLQCLLASPADECLVPSHLAPPDGAGIEARRDRTTCRRRVRRGCLVRAPGSWASAPDHRNHAGSHRRAAAGASPAGEPRPDRAVASVPEDRRPRAIGGRRRARLQQPVAGDRGTRRVAAAPSGAAAGTPAPRAPRSCAPPTAGRRSRGSCSPSAGVRLLVPEVLDLNATVRSLERMLTRVIGEDVQFVTTLAADLASVRVDPGPDRAGRAQPRPQRPRRHGRRRHASKSPRTTSALACRGNIPDCRSASRLAPGCS